VESQRPEDQDRAEDLLDAILPKSGGAHRIGISGAPGVGKSTFIESFGLHLLTEGKSVAVLAVDPSSGVSGGSILGDKARMHRLAQRPGAFIRPSPSAQTLGGVARRTREAMLLCEAAGYDVVVIETVGVGQSEARVAGMVDFFLVLLHPGGGDELQGVKRGILEFADVIAVNKADGDTLAQARITQAEYSSALRHLARGAGVWVPRVVLTSARSGEGIAELWALIVEHRSQALASGAHAERRRAQNRHWLWSLLEDSLLETFRAHPSVRDRMEEVERLVEAGQLAPGRGARDLLGRFGGAGRLRE
jgi:LAO/AO transport system kinase